MGQIYSVVSGLLYTAYENYFRTKALDEANLCPGEMNKCPGCESATNATKCEYVRVPCWIPAKEGIPEMLGVDVPCKDNLLWAITFAYLIENEELPENVRYKFLECNLKSAQTKVSEYNPFIDRYSCFSDKKVLKFIKNFEKLLRNEENVIKAAAYLLNCKIQLLTYKSGQWADCQTFTDGCLCLIQSENTSQISFALGKKIGLTLHQKALRDVYTNCGTIDETSIDNEDCYPKDNLTVSLLKQGHSEIVNILYTFPPYIFEKLQNIGFCIDLTKERCKDGKSVFYYAHDFELLLTLYHYAVNYPKWWRLANREFNPENIKNMGDIKVVLVETIEQVKSSSGEILDTNSKAHLLQLQQLQRINNYRLNLAHKLEATAYRLSTKVSQTEKAKYSRCVVLNVLNVHEEHLMNTREHEMYSIYKSHSASIDYIEKFTALVIFDYFSPLKAVSKSEEKRFYETMENSFSKFLFFCFNKIGSEFESFTPVEREYFMFRKRLDFLNILHKLTSKLKQCEIKADKKFHPHISKEILPEREPGNLERNILQSHISPEESEQITTLAFISEKIGVLQFDPELHDHYMLDNLLQYIEIVGSLDFDNKLILESVIKYVLQSLGETVKPNHRIPTTVVKSLLVSAFPSEITKQFSEIRDNLSHYDEQKHIPPKAFISDENHFWGIKKDFETVKNNLHYIRDIEYFLFRKHLLKDVESVIILDKDPCPEEKKICNTIAEKIKGITKKLNEEFYADLERLIPAYERHFCNHYDQIRDRCELVEQMKEGTKTKAMKENEQNNTNQKSHITKMNKKLDYFVCLYNFFVQHIRGNGELLQGENPKILDEKEFTIRESIIMEAGNKLETIKQLDLFLKLQFRIGQVTLKDTESFRNILGCFTKMVTKDDIAHVLKNIKVIRSDPDEGKELPENDPDEEKEPPDNDPDEKKEPPENDPDEKKKTPENNPDGEKKTPGNYTDEEKNTSGNDSDEKKKPPEDKFVQLIEELKTLNEQNYKTLKTDKDTREILEKIEGVPVEEPLSFLLNWLRIFTSKINNTFHQTINEKDRLLMEFQLDKAKQYTFELLYFECITMLREKIKEPTAINQLWTRESHFFHDTDLRNSMAHDNLLDSVTSFTDETFALMDELIRKVAVLLRDVPGIKELKELRNIKQKSDLDFVRYIIDDIGPKKIRNLKYAEDYLKLMRTD